MKEISDANNTYVIDPEDAAETARLIEQAREVNRVVGLFPQGMDTLKADAKILDVSLGRALVEHRSNVMRLTFLSISHTSTRSGLKMWLLSIIWCVPSS